MRGVFLLSVVGSPAKEEGFHFINVFGFGAVHPGGAEEEGAGVAADAADFVDFP